MKFLSVKKDLKTTFDITNQPTYVTIHTITTR